MMEFHLAKFNSDKFGILEDTRIELPLFLPIGDKFIKEVPPLLANPTRLENIIQKNTIEARDLFDEDDDETIRAVVHKAIVLVALIDDQLEVDSIKQNLLIQTSLIMLRINTDNFAEEGEEFDVDISYRSFAKRFNTLESLFLNYDVETAELICPLAAKPLIYIRSISRDLESDGPEIKERLKALSVLPVTKGLAMTLVHETEGFDDDTLDELNAQSSSKIYLMEYLVIFRGLIIAPDIRRTYLFQRLSNRLDLALRLFSEVITLRTDAEKEETRFNGILRFLTTSPGITLAQALQLRVEKLKRVLNDVATISRKLCSTYPADENIQEYTEIVLQFWDAGLCYHLHMPKSPEFRATLVAKNTSS